MRTVLHDVPQADKLRSRLEENNLHHGDIVRADLDYVIADPSPAAKSVASLLKAPFSSEVKVRFCGVHDVKVNGFVAKGDDGPLPDTVVIKGLNIRRPGRYKLINALITVNGAMTVEADQLTGYERKEEMEV